MCVYIYTTILYDANKHNYISLLLYIGKGLIQTLEPLSQGGVAITTAKYETPKHNNINKVCIINHVYT